jgi:transposase InsO family protein
MSAIGSSADNALAESFNATFKRETLRGRKHWAGEREARLDAFRWLHRYNVRLVGDGAAVPEVERLPNDINYADASRITRVQEPVSGPYL